MKPGFLAVCGLPLLLFINSCSSPDLVALEDRYDYDGLKEFAFLVCVSHSYRMEGQFRIATELDREAWDYVARSEFPAGLYFKLFQAGKALGYQIPAQQAVRVCSQWRRSKDLDRLLYGP